MVRWGPRSVSHCPLLCERRKCLPHSQSSHSRKEGSLTSGASPVSIRMSFHLKFPETASPIQDLGCIQRNCTLESFLPCILWLYPQHLESPRAEIAWPQSASTWQWGEKLPIHPRHCSLGGEEADTDIPHVHLSFLHLGPFWAHGKYYETSVSAEHICYSCCWGPGNQTLALSKSNMCS